VFGFLHEYGLEHEIKVNIEANHATLAGHSFHHEIATAVPGHLRQHRRQPRRPAKRLGHRPVPNSVEEMTLATYEILKAGGFKNGGYNLIPRYAARAWTRSTCSTGMSPPWTPWRWRWNARGDGAERSVAAVQGPAYAGWQQPLGQAVLAGEFSLNPWPNMRSPMS
jgi:xylose isomerase